MEARVYYVVNYSEGYGRGSFSPLNFKSLEDAQQEIERTKDGKDTKEEYRAYWKEVGENMYITKKTVIEERIEEDSVIDAILKASHDFGEYEGDRSECYECDDMDGAFEAECSQRDAGHQMACIIDDIFKGGNNE